MDRAIHKKGYIQSEQQKSEQIARANVENTNRLLMAFYKNCGVLMRKSSKGGYSNDLEAIIEDDPTRPGMKQIKVHPGIAIVKKIIGGKEYRYVINAVSEYIYQLPSPPGQSVTYYMKLRYVDEGKDEVPFDKTYADNGYTYIEGSYRWILDNNEPDVNNGEIALARISSDPNQNNGNWFLVDTRPYADLRSFDFDNNDKAPVITEITYGSMRDMATRYGYASDKSGPFLGWIKIKWLTLIGEGETYSFLVRCVPVNSNDEEVDDEAIVGYTKNDSYVFNGCLATIRYKIYVYPVISIWGRIGNPVSSNIIQFSTPLGAPTINCSDAYTVDYRAGNTVQLSDYRSHNGFRVYWTPIANAQRYEVYAQENIQNGDVFNFIIEGGDNFLSNCAIIPATRCNVGWNVKVRAIDKYGVPGEWGERSFVFGQTSQLPNPTTLRLYHYSPGAPLPSDLDNSLVYRISPYPAIGQPNIGAYNGCHFWISKNFINQNPDVDAFLIEFRPLAVNNVQYPQFIFQTCCLYRRVEDIKEYECSLTFSGGAQVDGYALGVIPIGEPFIELVDQISVRCVLYDKNGRSVSHLLNDYWKSDWIPPSPGNIRIERLVNGIKLLWSYDDADEDNILGFNIYIKNDSAPPGANDDYFVDSVPAKAREYVYYVPIPENIDSPVTISASVCAISKDYVLSEASNVANIKVVSSKSDIQEIATEIYVARGGYSNLRAAMEALAKTGIAWENVRIVGKGGHFESIQAAVNSLPGIDEMPEQKMTNEKFLIVLLPQVFREEVNVQNRFNIMFMGCGGIWYGRLYNIDVHTEGLNPVILMDGIRIVSIDGNRPTIDFAMPIECIGPGLEIKNSVIINRSNESANCKAVALLGFKHFIMKNCVCLTEGGNTLAPVMSLGGSDTQSEFVLINNYFGAKGSPSEVVIVDASKYGWVFRNIFDDITDQSANCMNAAAEKLFFIGNIYQIEPTGSADFEHGVVNRVTNIKTGLPIQMLPDWCK